MSNPKLSIIIPIYNVEQYLKECLDSVINQTLKDIEIICIDDKSTDNSLKVLKEYKKKYDKDNKIIIIEQKTNQGQGIARNKGIDIAKGEYIGFIDSDDFIDLNYFEELYNKAKEYNIKVCQSNNIIMYYEKNDKRNRNFMNFNNNGESLLKITSENINYIPPMSWCKIYKRTYLNKYNLRFPQENIKHEDNFFDNILNSYLMLDNEPLYLSNSAIYYYRQRLNSIMAKNISATDIIKAVELVYDNYKKRKILDYIGLNFSDIIYRFQESIYPNDFYLEVKKFFNKIKKDNLINLSYNSLIYTQKQIDFYKNVLIYDTYKEYKYYTNIDFIKEEISKFKEKITFLGIPILKIKYKKNKYRIYLFSFIPILVIKEK